MRVELVEDRRRFQCGCGDAPEPTSWRRRSFLVRTCGLAVWGLTGLGPDIDRALAGEASIIAAGSGSDREYPIPATDGVSIDRGAQVILVRVQHRAYAFALACPHQNTALKWLTKELRFQCPKHDSKYRPDGTFFEGRATRNMDRFAISTQNDTLHVDTARWFQSDRDQAGWSAAYVEL